MIVIKRETTPHRHSYHMVCVKIAYTSIKFSLKYHLIFNPNLFYSFEMHLWDTSLTHSPLFFIFIASKRQADAIFDSRCLMNSYSISDISRMYLPIVRVSMEALAHYQKTPIHLYTVYISMYK